LKKLLFIYFLIILSSCKEKIKDIERIEVVEAKTLNIDFCEPASSELTAITYYMFIIDDSGSNVFSDPRGDRRLLSLLDFISYEIPGNDKYSLVLFGDEVKEFADFSPLDEFNDSLRTLEFANDSFSKAFEALEFAKEKIETFANENDPKFNKDGFTVNFQIFFATDGVAIDETGVVQNYQQFIDLVKGTGSFINSGLVDLIKERPSVQNIQLHTAYFPLGETDNSPVTNDQAENFMRELAVAGNGQSITFGEGTNISFKNFKAPKAKLKKELIQLYAVSKNLKWTKQGELVRDSDADGIEDSLELKLGSDPYSFDTDQDGVSDLVALRALGHPCSESNCQGPKNRVNSFCSSFLRPEDLLNLIDTDSDQFGNCDETIVRTSITNPDTNFNFIDDKREYFLGFNPLQENLLNSDSDGDGITDLDEIIKGLPPQVHNDQIITDDQFGEITYKITNIEKIKNFQTTTCYKIEINNIPGIKGTDEIEINMVFTNPFILNQSYFYRSNMIFSELGNKVYSNDDFFEIVRKAGNK
jgi:hypothetical protein